MTACSQIDIGYTGYQEATAHAITADELQILGLAPAGLAKAAGQ